jgi:acetolactate synthase-1/2/3 large subunit
MKRTGAQIIWECLVKEGVKTVFGYPGGAILPVYDAMLDYPIHHVLVRHEQAAAHMADGYARASGQVGVAIATSGPGATNLVTGIATAQMDSSPTVFITGQVPSRYIGYDAFQETDITGITLPITKHNYLVTDIHDLTGAIREAFFIARSGRPGPVLVDVAKDVQQASIDWNYEDESIQLPGYRPDMRPLSSDIQHAVEMIQAARQPVILAGHGVLMSGAMYELRELAEKTRTPVAMTLLGIGCLPADHPLNLGMMGMHGEAWVNHWHAFRRPGDGQFEHICPAGAQDSLRDRSIRGQQECEGRPGADRGFTPVGGANPASSATLRPRRLDRAYRPDARRERCA